MTLQLLDLHPDVMFKILRDHVPLPTKLRTLWEMPEFRPLLEHRASYLDSPAPFSLNYLDFLRDLRPGWYHESTHFNHRVYLRIDEAALRVSMFHFDLKRRREDHRPNSSCSFYRESVDYTRRKFRLRERLCFENGEDLLTYYLNDYGFVTIRPCSAKTFYCDDLKYAIDVGQCFFLHGFFSVFEASLSSEKKLIVKRYCLFGDYRCDCRVQVLCPITFEITKDFKYLTWDGGDPVPMTGSEHYWLEDEEHVEGFRIYHGGDPLLVTSSERHWLEDEEYVEDFRIRHMNDNIKEAKSENEIKHDERLKKFLWT